MLHQLHNHCDTEERSHFIPTLWSWYFCIGFSSLYQHMISCIHNFQSIAHRQPSLSVSYTITVDKDNQTNLKKPDWNQCHLPIKPQVIPLTYSSLLNQGWFKSGSCSVALCAHLQHIRCPNESINTKDDVMIGEGNSRALFRSAAEQMHLMELYKKLIATITNKSKP